MIDNELKNK